MSMELESSSFYTKNKMEEKKEENMFGANLLRDLQIVLTTLKATSRSFILFGMLYDAEP